MLHIFHQNNRSRLYETLEDGTALLVFSGHAPRKTADERYPFFANRNFVYLTGIEKEQIILLAEKEHGSISERLFILKPDLLKERWNGRRISEEEARTVSGVQGIYYLSDFYPYLNEILRSGRFCRVALDLYKWESADEDTEAFAMADQLRHDYPHLQFVNLSDSLKAQRVIKQPCEIEAMKKAVKITREGILAMMYASKPGMYEYQYKAEFDYALTQHGVPASAFPSIISAGRNNFCLHYNEYTGQAEDGDMILNDVGAKYDGLCNDVSRGWPCNGIFSEKQQLLYTCAYNTSEHMFRTIRPGMPMKDVDRLVREYCYEQLHEIGLCHSYEEVGTYMWHGGAHHVGYDVHDTVGTVETTAPGMVFCVDVGIYCEEWGIGFRLEDNCLVTEDGCENLTASIPRTIEEIEAVMSER